MLKIAICDDEPRTRAGLASLIRAQDRPCEITAYASAGAFLADRRDFDLLFLDIALDASGPDGMALARRIREDLSASQPVIVFVTGYERYVFDAFDVGAFQYLLKPVDEEKFAQVFARAAGQIEAARETPLRALTLRSAGIRRSPVPRNCCTPVCSRPFSGPSSPGGAGRANCSSSSPPTSFWSWFAITQRFPRGPLACS